MTDAKDFSNLTFEIDGNVEDCRELCNSLMAFQKSKATMQPEVFDYMNFDTRLKRSYDSAAEKQLITVKDKGVPVAYVFSTVDAVSAREQLPPWAKEAEGQKMLGFYPDWKENHPEKTGALSQLYIKDDYRGAGLGSKLFDMAIKWIEGHDDIDRTFVYISNGNKAAYEFYLKHGFEYSHDVFGGFIIAAVRMKSK